MAKKKKQFHGIHITPKAGTHYEVRHDPKMEPSEGKGEIAMPTMATMDSDKNEKLFSHGERAGLHKHIDDLMDAHEGKAAGEAEPDADDMPAADHPLHQLRRKS